MRGCKDKSKILRFDLLVWAVVATFKFAFSAWSNKSQDEQVIHNSLCVGKIGRIVSALPNSSSTQNPNDQIHLSRGDEQESEFCETVSEVRCGVKWTWTSWTPRASSSVLKLGLWKGQHFSVLSKVYHSTPSFAQHWQGLRGFWHHQRLRCWRGGRPIPAAGNEPEATIFYVIFLLRNVISASDVFNGIQGESHSGAAPQPAQGMRMSSRYMYMCSHRYQLTDCSMILSVLKIVSGIIYTTVT